MQSVVEPVLLDECGGMRAEIGGNRRLRRSGSSRRPNIRMSPRVPATRGMPTTAHSKKRIGPRPAISASAEAITFTGVPSRVTFDPASAANATGIISCDGTMPVRTAMMTATGIIAATAPFMPINALNSALRSISANNSRDWLAPACRIRIWPAQVPTPDASRPAPIASNEATKTMTGSPNHPAPPAR
jgi:hypothetical protein